MVRYSIFDHFILYIYIVNKFLFFNILYICSPLLVYHRTLFVSRNSYSPRLDPDVTLITIYVAIFGGLKH